MLSLPTALVVLAAVALGSAVQRISGMGVGLICSPVLSLLLGPALGVTFTNTITVFSATIIGLTLWRDADRARLAVILPCTVLGAIPAAFLVRETPTAWLNVIVGGLLVVSLSTSAILARLGRLPHADGPAVRGLTGALGAFLNTTAGVAASATVVYAAVSRWDQRSFAASMQPTFFLMGLLSVITKVAVGATPLSALPPPWFLVLVAGVVALSVFGAGRLARHVPARTARRIAVLLAGTGALLALGRGIVQLLA